MVTLVPCLQVQDTAATSLGAPASGRGGRKRKATAPALETISEVKAVYHAFVMSVGLKALVFILEVHLVQHVFVAWRVLNRRQLTVRLGLLAGRTRATQAG